MGIVKRDEVMFYHVGEELVCGECIKDEELLEVGEEDIIMTKVPGEELYFCDRCKKQIIS